MNKTYLVIICMLMLLFTACSKKNGVDALSDSSVTFDVSAGKDTVQIPLSIKKDSIIVVKFKASLSGGTSANDHWVNFAVDTSRINTYRTKYGQAQLLPSGSYLFYKPLTQIAAGASSSEQAQLNIVLQSKLTELTTYVLPIVIQSVDGKVEGAASPTVLYYVFKTGASPVISKAGWTIAGVSSIFNTFRAQNLLDDDKKATYWTSNITGVMPQWVSINFNRNITFSAVNYSLPTLLNYPSLGGYPTSIQIETSMDGIAWVNKGIFQGNISNNTQTLNTGLTTARYLRFTSLASVKYSGIYSAIFISDISLMP
ncbi:BT_3987 domain-containing protein [Pedobacter hartonius]|uniref:F5/8 type C domain-containing protein n=1 Tax=Pedobacter hartonius TaxID=425514 RepID=A0A1H4CTF7_9SPHI|nr:DUF1735 domain-containing protein [Pedobacter hartonius]SEA63598.1 F5/8 type C domain-containing protein [Pedobacter hartonius]